MVKVKYHEIFLAFLKIGLIAFGGGAAAIPLFHKQIIDKNNWLSDEEFSDILTVTNALPGPMQTKIAGYIGYRLKGIIGMLLSLLAIITPSLLLMSIFLTWIYHNKDKPWMNGLTQSIFPVITVMMVALTINFLSKTHKLLNIIHHGILLLSSIIVLVIFNIHPAILIVIVLGLSFIPKINELKRILIILFLSLIIVTLNYFQIPQTLFSYLKLPTIYTTIKYLQIFFAFFIPGIIGYGGGPASIPLVEYEVVQHFNLVNSKTFDLAYAVQATLPGVTATKLAGYLGF